MSMQRMANLPDLARYFFAIHRRRRRGGAAADGSHFIDVHAHFLPDFYVKEMRRARITDVDGWPPCSGQTSRSWSRGRSRPSSSASI
jgi:hypothetical protein